MMTPEASLSGAGLDFAAIFQASPNPYMLLDRELRYAAANEAYLRATGARLEDLLGRRVIEVFPNDPADPNNPSARRLVRSFERVLETGEADVLPLLPYRVPREQGGALEERYWSATHTPIVGAGGEVTHVLQHTVDVTEMHQLKLAAAGQAEGSEEAGGAGSGGLLRAGAGVIGRARQAAAAASTLGEQLRELRQMFEQSPGFMCFLRSPDFRIELANDTYLRLMGAREILGKTVREVFPEIESQGYFDLLDRVARTREAFVGHGMRALVRRAPGPELEERFFDVVYQPIFEGEGPLVGIFVQGHDITQQKLAEADRRDLIAKEQAARHEAESAAREHRFLADSIPQQVWTAQPDGQLDFINARGVDYFASPAEQILGAGWQAVIHPEDLPACVARWGHSLATGEPYEVEFRLRRGDGAYRWHLGRAVTYRDESGVIRRWFGTNTDIDEAKRFRDELRARSESEQRLIGIVSHDLRNPLNAIGLTASLLLLNRSPGDPDTRHLTRMAASIERAGRLISDFLEFAQSRSSGDIPVRPRAANLRDLIQLVVDEARLSDPSRPVAVSHEGAETGWWDADRLTQVLGNLVGNAFQHSPPSEPISVSSRIEGNEVEITIHNGGAPIPPADIAQLFEPFRRGSKAQAARGRSVGLGLYIARQVVAAHGGEISVHSTREAGTRLTVRMPREVRGRGDGAAPPRLSDQLGSSRFQWRCWAMARMNSSAKWRETGPASVTTPRLEVTWPAVLASARST